MATSVTFPASQQGTCCKSEEMLRQQPPHLHRSGWSAHCEFKPGEMLRAARISAMWAATAEL